MNSYLGGVFRREWGTWAHLGATTVQFKSSNSGNKNYTVWHEIRITAFYIEELLHANISTKASLCNNETFFSNKLQGDTVCDNR